MNILNILHRMLNMPNSVKIYRDLHQYYLSTGQINEAQAINFLIESKFPKNEDPADNSDIN